MAKFYGIGVGPGDPELITIKAAKILNTIDVVLLPDSQTGKKNIAYEIARREINSQAKLVSVNFPMVSDRDTINQAGKTAARLVEEHVKEGKNVAFITLGDPSLYSTYGYIVKNLSVSTEVETIPGITSFCAAAAVTNRPLVEGEEILSIIPATASEEKMESIFAGSQSQVFMKVYNHKDKVLKMLEKHGMMEHSILVKRCGFEDCSVEDNLTKALSKEKQYLSIILSRKG
ncbi:MAG: precorrin-2 C(20)-methyltransferase [Desulfitobacteriaceae bacterium]|nr:precorrin-2 C(20)-methyltransferase [Desulfitobacteriaceae bacterium]